MAETSFKPEYAHSGKDRRITLPQHYRSRIAWLEGEAPISAWLLLIQPGRFRLLSDSDIENYERLAAVRSLIIDGPNPVAVRASEFESNARAARIGRLIPITIEKGATRRLVLPREVVQGDQDRWAFVLLFSLGFLEIWVLDAFTAASSCPLDSAI